MFKEANKQLPANRHKQRVVLVDGDIIKYRIGFAAQATMYHVYVPYKFPEGHALEGNDIHLPYVFEGKRAFNEWAEKYEIDPATLEWEAKVVPDPIENALHSVRRNLESIQKNTNADRVHVILSGKGNYRDDIATSKKYKGNRDDVARPYHYEEIDKYLREVWKAEVVDGMEADDRLGILQYEDYMKAQLLSTKHKRPVQECTHTIIATLDKDLDMIPGWHYNWTKESKTPGVEGWLYFIDPWKANKNFWIQCICGDSTDNIGGVRGLGKKRAEHLIKECKTHEEFMSAAKRAYEQMVQHDMPDAEEDARQEQAQALMDETAQLVWICRNRDDIGKPPYDSGYTLE